MPTPTYTALANITLGSSASSVTFSSIPATYRDLVLVFNGSVTSGIQSIAIRLNSDSGSNYSAVDAQGTGSSTGSGTSSGTSSEVGVVTTTLSSVISQFMDGSATDKHKTFLSRSDGAADRTRMTASRWANTAAVTTIQVFTSGSFTTGSTFALYGIAS